MLPLAIALFLLLRSDTSLGSLLGIYSQGKRRISASWVKGRRVGCGDRWAFSCTPGGRPRNTPILFTLSSHEPSTNLCWRSQRVGPALGGARNSRKAHVSCLPGTCWLPIVSPARPSLWGAGLLGWPLAAQERRCIYQVTLSSGEHGLCGRHRR